MDEESEEYSSDYKEDGGVDGGYADETSAALLPVVRGIS